MKRSLFVKRRLMGFTLAEVLITLTIIGVIAALTIPALITDIQDAQYRTAWKKAYSDLNQVTSRLMMDNGGTLNGVFLNSDDLLNKYLPYLSYTKACGGGDLACWHQANNWYSLNGGALNWGGTHTAILGNGNLIYLELSAQDCTNTSMGGNNMPICGYMYTDVNGFKGPNTVGKDIYVIWITQNGLSPWGYHDNRGGTCKASSSGWGCAALYLMQ